MMGKKVKNSDGTKKKKSICDDDSVTFEGDFIWQLKIGVGTSLGGLDFCSYCGVEVPINIQKLREHYNSKPHLNRQAIHYLLPLFTKHTMDWVCGKKKFYCEEHDMELEAKAKVLLRHLEDHTKMVDPNNDGGDEDFENIFKIIKLFKFKLWKVDLKSTNAGLNKQMLAYQRIQSPVTVVEDSPSKMFIFDLRSDVFSQEDLTLMTKVASHLEKNGDYVERAKHMQSSNMNAFGMRWAKGDTGWYKHKDTDLYRLSEDLATFVSNKLEEKYPKVFLHLRKILEIEGFGLGGATIGSSVFTTFCITRDYNCRPHDDQDDYDFGFVIWLQEDYVAIHEDISIFTFPEFKCAFSPKHGDVLCFKAKYFQHCTRAFEKRNQLGLAFFQKASLFRQLKKLLDLPFDGVMEHYFPPKGKSGPKTIIEKRCDFELKKDLYMKELAEGKMSLQDF